MHKVQTLVSRRVFQRLMRDFNACRNHTRGVLRYVVAVLSLVTVVPGKSDTDVVFCLQS